MLGPIAEAWFNHKLKRVQQLFEQTITAGTIRMANDTIERATAQVAEIKNSMDICAKEIK
jgi:protein-tyrosine-phosphatase